MTTQAPETLEAVELWLAERLPELQRECNGCDSYGDWPHGYPPAIGHLRECRGWVPNVTMDAVDGALMALGYHVSRARVNDEYRTLYSWPDDSSWSRIAYGATAHESACLAAKLVLQ